MKNEKAEKHPLITIMICVETLKWAKQKANKRVMNYKAAINEVLLEAFR